MRPTFALLICLCLSPQLQGQLLTDVMSKLSIHGYVSQAWATSEDHQIFGIPTDGTTDYRDLALQFRYDQSRENVFVVQLRHQRLGDSPQAESIDDVRLDWAFYQRRFSDRFSLKAGRIPLPLGIFNEAEGAGATFPFYRLPDEFYVRQYTSKTLEGVLATTSIGGPGGWSFDADAYFGQWALDQWSETSSADARNAWGTQLWANTPIEGVRIGGGAYRCTVEQYAGYPADYLMLHGSLEADLDRWRFAAEYLRGDLDFYGRYHAWYGQAGVNLNRRLSVHARLAVARLELPRNGDSSTARISDDFGLALNYAIHHGLLLKLEGHTNEGLLRDDLPRNLLGPPEKTRYFIASIVATF
ncbi:MAG TPA: hypothetical protein VM779_15920 [Thermoanaerobaculia bacterium]|nr:hypothetical protein [Thermoanaerobaculia bacterium]